MSVEVGGWLALMGFFGLCLSAWGWNNSKRGSILEALSALGVLISVVAAVVMVFQGFHLWNTGWEIDLTQMDPATAGRTAARARGRGGIILLVIKFFPQFLVFGYGMTIYQSFPVAREAGRHFGLFRPQRDT